MDTKQLNTFRHLAKTLNFSKTADQLNFAQSTVSEQIRSLENELRLTLFDRLGKKVVLTEQGRSVLEYARQFMTIEDQFITSLKKQDQISGNLNIYAPNTICVHHLPHLLTTYRAQHDKVNFKLRAHLGSKRALSELKRGSIDAAILMEETFEDKDLNIIPLRSEQIIFICNNDHPLAQTVVSLNDLKFENFITTEPSCGYRAILAKKFLEQGHKLEPVMWFDNTEAIKQCVISNMGISFLPKIAVTQDMLDGKFKQIHVSEKFNDQIKLQLITHKDKWISPALKHFIDALEKAYGNNPRS